MNIPIYRAKKLDSAEYVEGYLLPSLISNAMHRILVDNGSIYFVDDLTLSVHFPDMIDSQGNKIFASLSEDGKGGDILDISGRTETLFIEEAVIQTYMFKWDDLKDFKKKAIGIQE